VDGLYFVYRFAMRYLALGDSYTVGEDVAEDERFPEQLVARLRADGWPALESPEIVATTGWTTAELQGALAAAPPRGRFDLVTLLIGVNNQYRGLPLEQYRHEFGALLDTAIVYAGERRERVIVVSIPDWGVTPYAQGRDRARIASEIDSYNRANRDAAVRERVNYVDITPISRLSADDPGLTAGDGLHPSGAMYRLWVELLLPKALAALSAD